LGQTVNSVRLPSVLALSLDVALYKSYIISPTWKMIPSPS